MKHIVRLFFYLSLFTLCNPMHLRETPPLTPDQNRQLSKILSDHTCQVYKNHLYAASSIAVLAGAIKCYDTASSSGKSLTLGYISAQGLYWFWGWHYSSAVNEDALKTMEQICQRRLSERDNPLFVLKFVPGDDLHDKMINHLLAPFILNALAVGALSVGCSFLFSGDDVPSKDFLAKNIYFNPLALPQSVTLKPNEKPITKQFSDLPQSLMHRECQHY